MKVAAAFLVLLVACGDDGGSSDRPKPTSAIDVLKGSFAKPDPVAKIMRTLEAFKDRTCTCRDQACAEQVEKDMMDWAQKNMDELTAVASKPTKAQQEEAERITDAMQRCKEKLETAYEPPAEAPAAP